MKTTEPVLTAAAVHSAVIAIVGALAVFNVWHPSDVQVEAIFGLYLALAPYLAFFLRSKVTPVASSTGV